MTVDDTQFDRPILMTTGTVRGHFSTGRPAMPASSSAAVIPVSGSALTLSGVRERIQLGPKTVQPEAPKEIGLSYAELIEFLSDLQSRKLSPAEIADLRVLLPDLLEHIRSAAFSKDDAGVLTRKIERIRGQLAEPEPIKD